MSFINIRNIGYQMLSGRGLEIGAFEHPARLPGDCKVEYLDVISVEEAKAIFPEVDHSLLKEVDYILDISADGLDQFSDETFDFVIINHVLEHLANPIKVISSIFRITKQSGYVVMGIPDKHYTFDRNRPLTPYADILNRFETDINDTVPEDFRDMVEFVHPELKVFPEEHIYRHLENFKRRREHVNIWDSDTFKGFLNHVFVLLNISCTIIYESSAEKNGFEYFGIFRKD